MEGKAVCLTGRLWQSVTLLRSEAAAAAPRETAALLLLEGVWGPPLVSGSWPCTTAVAPIPRGCCLPGLEDLIPQPPPSYPRGWDLLLKHPTPD